jgi:PAS domain S-box-containing protein
MSDTEIRLFDAEGSPAATFLLADAPREAAETPMLPPTLPNLVAERILALVSDAVVCVDAAHSVVLFNAAAEKLFGCRTAEVIGTPLAELAGPDRVIAGVRPNGASPARLPAERRWPEQGELVVVRRDGSPVPVEIRSSVIDDAGETTTVYLLRDRTEKWRADEEQRLLQDLSLAIAEASDLESALRLALQMIGEVTGWTAGESWLPDAAGKRIQRGPVWSRLDGLADFHKASEEYTFAPGQGLPGRAWRSGKAVWVDDITTDPEFLRSELAQACGLHTGIAIPVLASDKVVAVIAFYHTEIREKDVRLIGLVSAVAAQVGTLIQRRRTEEALQRHAEDLARSNAELEQFAYVASHDLQEPLRMVASYTQLLAKRYGDKLDGDAHEFIDFAVEGVTRMQQLIHDLLAFSRVGTRGEPFQPTSLDAVLDRVLRDIEPAVEACGAQITREPLPVVNVDAAQLYQVFQNLIVNALKFRGSEPPQVRISVAREKESWVIAVTDNGIGIAEEYFPRIWALFQRLHSRAEYPGTGIGLSICKKIVERHGGRIWVESEPGHGSTFFFTLTDREPSPAAN